MRVALAIVLGAIILALSGCSGSSEVAAAPPTAPVIAPGKPGEPAKTLPPGEAATALPPATANAADILFMQDMVIHHRQAVDMSLLVPARAGSADLKRLASRILDTQGPEITMMTTWLRQQGQDVPAHHARHQTMPGMATPEQLDQLKAASGTAFDRLYVRLMTTHHRGAITMASEILTRGAHYRVQEIAEDISVTQIAEINRLQRLGG